MNIEFIAHAGFCVHAGGLQILIDPWLTPSNFENPIIDSFASHHRTIDYLIPEPIRTLEDFNPDIILISHYHAHHSSKLDIEHWLQKSSKKIDVIGPTLYPGNETDFLKLFSERFPQHRFLTQDDDGVLTYGSTKIRCLTHTEKYHLAYFIEHKAGSFLHIADARINRMPANRNLDPAWYKFKGLKPTLLSCSVGSVSSRSYDDNKVPFILENTFQSPVEAASLAQEIQPQVASIMGIYNFSIWKNRIEFGFSPYENEAYFRWAIQHIDSKMDAVQLRPGMNFEIDENGSYALKLRP